MEQKLEYINKGRGGFVIYKDNESQIKLEFEFGGGNCVAIIYVPSIDKWESQTNKSISERENILLFIADQSIKDQAQNCIFKLSEDCIEIFRK